MLENLNDTIGDKVPKWFKPFLEKMRSKIEDKTTPDFCKENPNSDKCKTEGGEDNAKTDITQ